MWNQITERDKRAKKEIARTADASYASEISLNISKYESELCWLRSSIRDARAGHALLNKAFSSNSRGYYYGDPANTISTIERMQERADRLERLIPVARAMRGI